MFFKGQKYRNECVSLIMRASSVEKENALHFFNHIKSLSEYDFNYKVGEPAPDVILAYITVFNEMCHIYMAHEAGDQFNTKLGKSGHLTLLSLVMMAYAAGKQMPNDEQFKKHLPKQFPDRFNDFCRVKLPTVSRGLVSMKVWMEELPASETIGIAAL